MRKCLRVLAVALFAGLFLFSAWNFAGALKPYLTSRTVYDALDEYVSFADAGAPHSQPTASQRPSDAENAAVQQPSAQQAVDFEALAAINPDTVGWLHIEGTNISYPVVQGSDNEYYLDHLFDGTPNKSGCIFLDHRSEGDFSNQHSILYGHHMKDKTMFGELVHYREQSFYQAHPTALLMTPTASYTIRFFSGYVADDLSGAWALAPDAAWLKERQALSCFEAEHVPSPEDRLLTLSTCTYEFENAKFVLHGSICETDAE